jgi:hypothetical protein
MLDLSGNLAQHEKHGVVMILSSPLFGGGQAILAPSTWTRPEGDSRPLFTWAEVLTLLKLGRKEVITYIYRLKEAFPTANINRIEVSGDNIMPDKFCPRCRSTEYEDEAREYSNWRYCAFCGCFMGLAPLRGALPDKMPWGKYADQPFSKIPAGYLRWAKDWDKIRPELKQAIEAYLRSIEDNKKAPTIAEGEPRGI